MQQTSPLSTPDSWNAVAEGYAIDILPLFSRYAEDAIELAKLPANAHVLDVAAGPGTLSLIAARQAERVVAIDFAEEMTNVLRRRAEEEGLKNLEIVTGDGQSLSLADETFDAAFSMFGLIFFPDRAAGFRELLRVLKPERRAVVSSWAPIDQVPLMASLFGAIRSHLPDLPFGRDKGPLSDPDEFREEMSSAGFRSVEIHEVEHGVEVPTLEAFWQAQMRSSAPVALLREKLGDEAWKPLADHIIAHVERECGSGPYELSMPARLGVGVR